MARRPSLAPPAPPTLEPEAVAPPPTKAKVGINYQMPTEVHDLLRDIAYHERKKLKALLDEAVNMLFIDRGKPPIA